VRALRASWAGVAAAAAACEAAGVEDADGVALVLGTGDGVKPLGTMEGSSEDEGDGEGEGDGVAVAEGAVHSVPGR